MDIVNENHFQWGKSCTFSREIFCSDEFVECVVFVKFTFMVNVAIKSRKLKMLNFGSGGVKTSALELGRQALKQYKVVVYVYTGRSLAGHDGGFADPYLR